MNPEPHESINLSSHPSFLHQSAEIASTEITQGPLSIDSVLHLLTTSDSIPETLVKSPQWLLLPDLLDEKLIGDAEEKYCKLLVALTQIAFILCDSHILLSNKRPLLSSLQTLANSSTLSPKVYPRVESFLAVLKSVPESPHILVDRVTFETLTSDRTTHLLQIETLQKQLDDQKRQFERDQAKTKEENSKLIKELDTLKTNLQKTTQTNTEKDKTIQQLQATVSRLESQLLSLRTPPISTNVIKVFNSAHVKLENSVLTKKSADAWVSCFTKVITSGIHRLSIKTAAPHAMLGIVAPCVYPELVSKGFHSSGKAAAMYNNGVLYTGGETTHKNCALPKDQIWTAEANLSKKTLHFFIGGDQQPNHFVNIPVPLVFSIGIYDLNSTITITSWTELSTSGIQYEGTGHNLKG
ncbi:hypothetical protein BLNAU_21367 [Blattamonas nauphoetae]|uniref:TLDc domain-containing protein n=1 Tax=Blattamonas nauphoetae TaxID=2049346 RepID=A0ABQ9WW35_9EUKA|nr:hypothetical protein BLNAU_21367 [Blattamonas nauphoetae]